MKIIKNKLAINLFKFILIPALLVIGVYYLMQRGIKINSLDFKFIKISKLYIKLDKKIIFSAKRINILADKNPSKVSTLAELSNALRDLKYLYIFFQSFKIDELSFKDYHSKVLFGREKFYIDNNDFTLLMSLHEVNNEVLMKVQNFYSKRYLFRSKAMFKLDLRSKILQGVGELKGDLLSANYAFSLRKNKLNYQLSDIRTDNITKIFDSIEKYYKLPENLSLWVGGKVKGSTYVIKQLSGKVDLKSMNFYLRDIKAKGYVKDLSVVLGKGVSPISSPIVALSFANEKLDFYFSKLSYQGFDLSKSKIYIYDMLSDKAGIFLAIKTKAILDKRIHKILKLYDINIPIYQTSGSVNSTLYLKFGFDKPEDILYKGDFILHNVGFDNMLVRYGKMKLNKDKIIIKQASLSQKFFSIKDINASLNLAKSTGKASGIIKSLVLPKNALKMQNTPVNAKLDFNKGLKIFIPKYNLRLGFNKGLEVGLNPISKLLPFSPMAKEYGIHSGVLDIYTPDFKVLDIKLSDANITTPFLNTNYTPYDKDSFLAQINGDKVSLNTASGKLKLKDNHFYIKDLIYVNSPGNKRGQNMDLTGKNVSIYLKDVNKTLPFKTLNYQKKEGVINLKAHFDQAYFRLYESPAKFQLNFINIDDIYLNHFLANKIFSGGDFSINLEGKNQDFFTGKMLLKNTTVKGMDMLRRLVSFFDTIPSLLLFKSSSFNENGYKINYGYVDFKRAKDIMILKEINLQGQSIDIVGGGSINLRNKALNIELTLKTLKSASSIISSIPVINKIILGNKKQISTLIHVSGTISKPVFKTDFAQDAVSLPVNLIKNIIDLPQNMLGN